VIVRDLNFKRVAVTPFEADPPLIVDPNAVLAFPVPPQRFEPIVGRDPKILKGNRTVKD